jgi:hypothetical protein
MILNATTTAALNSIVTRSIDDPVNMQHVLIYALPLTCATVIAVLIFATIVYRRKYVLEKWNSLRKMRNTSPRCTERAGLRRDSEFESNDHSSIDVTMAEIDAQVPSKSEREFRLSTIA